MGQCNKMLEEMSFNALFQKLPVGIEVYDGRGQLVDLNRTDENLFAISRKDIMGINLFENPNFPEDTPYLGIAIQSPIFGPCAGGIFQRTRSLV